MLLYTQVTHPPCLKLRNLLWAVTGKLISKVGWFLEDKLSCRQFEKSQLSYGCGKSSSYSNADS